MKTLVSAARSIPSSSFKVSAEIPHRSPILQRFFQCVGRAELTRNFHAIRVLRVASTIPEGTRVVFTNHPSWWDPLVLLFLAGKLFPNRDAYGPIDAESLRRYGIFARIGFFGVEPLTRTGALAFLRTSAAILQNPRNMLWLTPQGKFCDERARPAALQRGLGHLGVRVPSMKFLPLAIEYDFWSEKRAEILLAFGAAVANEGVTHPDVLTVNFEQALEKTQNQLALAAQRREPREWDFLVRGRVGISPIYDAWRKLRSRFRPEEFSAEHRPE